MRSKLIGIRTHPGRRGCEVTGIAGCCYSSVDCIEIWVLINSDGYIQKVEQEEEEVDVRRPGEIEEKMGVGLKVRIKLLE